MTSKVLTNAMKHNILNCLKYNYDNGQKVFWAYETGKTFIKIY